ncbi:MAG: phospholipase, partial [Nocardioidaceae bacterium]|nr:phospholipase [Nocardioidaceae bacterium]
MTDPAGDWLLTTEERDNPHTRLPNRVPGNACTPLIHGAEYFARLVEVVESTREGDYVFFTDWRGDPDELLTDDGPTVGSLLCDAARRGANVRGLVWRSHLNLFGMSEEENQTLDKELEGGGAEVILDQRVHRFGSHHQKLVVVRFPSTPERDVAFVGGIDLCHSRRDDARHLGDRQVMPMAKAYGETPAWHDVQLEVRGPAVGALETVFRERREDPTNADSHNPIARIRDEIMNARLDTSPLPPVLPDPPTAGRQTVQPLCTYPAIKPPLDYAPDGERSIAGGYSKAILNATRLIYLEDQYMWSRDVAVLLARALRCNPRLHLVVVVPRVPD